MFCMCSEAPFPLSRPGLRITSAVVADDLVEIFKCPLATSKQEEGPGQLPATRLTTGREMKDFRPGFPCSSWKNFVSMVIYKQELSGCCLCLL